ncbi:MAG: hypothetical protein HY922_03275 [Elusimicrobia bacterium]|nr:hypothetical protein [Elusimicrobiota bacterium]
MKKLLGLAVLVSLLAPAMAAETPALNFDQGVDVKSVLNGARESAKEMKSVRAAWGEHYDTDCADVTLDARTTDSGAFDLVSRIYQEQCYPVGGPHEGQHCYDQLVAVERRTVNLRAEGRSAMLPWEKDVFEVCLSGWWLNARVRQASHKYSLDVPGHMHSGTIVAKALEKIASLPDPDGIAITSYEPGTGDFNLEFADKWSEYYPGEQTVLRILLRHDAFLGAAILEKEITLPAAAGYKLRLADYSAEFKSKPKPGHKYIVKWSFKRLGKVSKDAWVKERKSDSKPLGGASLMAVDDECKAAGLRTCTLRDIVSDQCVYRCTDGGEYRMPVDAGGAIVCPQIVFPF